MSATRKNSNIVKYKRKKHLNIGLIIFGIILFYLIATIVMYLTSPHIAVYEVRAGSILNDNAYTGLVIREEQVVYAADSGYFYHYAEEKSKVRVGSDVYALSNQELTFEDSASEELVLSQQQQQALIAQIQSFNQSFQEDEFQDTYRFQAELSNSLSSLTNHSSQDQIQSVIANASGTANLYQSLDDGILIYGVDGMESLTVEDVELEHLSETQYTQPTTKNNTYLQEGEPVYKILTGQSWTIIVELEKETYESLKEMNYINTRFTADDQCMWAEVSLTESEGHYIAYLTYEDCIRYAGQRYLDIELILEDEMGLKIPKSAVTTKDFYAVPLAYITQGGNSKNDGVLRQRVTEDGERITEFYAVDIYYQDESVAYLDPNTFQANDILLKPDSSEAYPLSDTESLQGVYNINKGYVVFKQIEILCENEEYYIVKEGSNYGLSNYDHIVLDADTANENDVVF